MPTRDQVLRAVHHLQHNCPTGVARTSQVARRLGVRAPSATARMKGLAAQGLVQYTSGRGAVLTEKGAREAAAAIQRQEMIERFLATILALPGDEIATETELFARHASNRVMQGIAQFLAVRPGNSEDRQDARIPAPENALV